MPDAGVSRFPHSLFDACLTVHRRERWSKVQIHSALAGWLTPWLYFFASLALCFSCPRCCLAAHPLCLTIARRLSSARVTASAMSHRHNDPAFNKYMISSAPSSRSPSPSQVQVNQPVPSATVHEKQLSGGQKVLLNHSAAKKLSQEAAVALTEGGHARRLRLTFKLVDKTRKAVFRGQRHEGLGAEAAVSLPGHPGHWQWESISRLITQLEKTAASLADWKGLDVYRNKQTQAGKWHDGTRHTVIADVITSSRGAEITVVE